MMGIPFILALGATTPVLATQVSKNAVVKSTTVKGDWIYDESNLDRKYASVTSLNGFKFPDSEAEDPTTLDLELFDFGGNYELRLSNRDAFFKCPSSATCTLQVSFDGGPYKKVDFEVTDGLDEGHINAKRSEYKALITSLKSSRTMRVKANFVNAGVKEYKFNVGGLKWPSPK